MSSCTDTIKAIFFIKKGMATKAFLKYAQNNDVKNIERQIKKGVLKKVKSA